MIYSRYAQQSDLKGLLHVVRSCQRDMLKWSKSYSVQKNEILLRDRLKSSPDDIVVAVENDTVIGYVLLSKLRPNPMIDPYLPLDRDQIGFVQLIQILPEYRKNGVASMLIQNNIQQARKKGFQSLFVQTSYNNIAMKKLLEKHGFSLLAEILDVEQRGEGGKSVFYYREL